MIEMLSKFTNVGQLAYSRLLKPEVLGLLLPVEVACGGEEVEECDGRWEVTVQSAFEDVGPEIDQQQIFANLAIGVTGLFGELREGQVVFENHFLPVVRVADGGDNVVLGFGLGGDE